MQQIHVFPKFVGGQLKNGTIFAVIGPSSPGVAPVRSLCPGRSHQETSLLEAASRKCLLQCRYAGLLDYGISV